MITGYPILDGLTGGFAKGNLITIAGGTLTGRTMFTMNILRNQLNVDAPSKIAFMTAEMDADDAEQKLLGLAGNEKDIERIKSSFAFCDIVKCCRDFEDFQIKICQLVKEKNLDAVVIDSFHFLPFYDDISPRKMSSVSRRLKFLARELNIVIVVTNRTNYRSLEQECVYRPQLIDLEQVGDLNYFSDVVLGLFRPEMLGISVDAHGYRLEGIIQIEILKSRKSFNQLISYRITPDMGAIEEVELIDKRQRMLF